MTSIKSYREVSQLETFEERFEYLKLNGVVGRFTFAHDRWMNQQFYTSRAWRQLRSAIIVRDNGCDLGIEGREIHDKIIIHHLNPIVAEDLHDGSPGLVDPDNLICVTHRTHNAIHYSDASLLASFKDREPGDTKLW